jgi:hypothetical protein
MKVLLQSVIMPYGRRQLHRVALSGCVRVAERLMSSGRSHAALAIPLDRWDGAYQTIGKTLSQRSDSLKLLCLGSKISIKIALKGQGMADSDNFCVTQELGLLKS